MYCMCVHRGAKSHVALCTYVRTYVCVCVCVYIRTYVGWMGRCITHTASSSFFSMVLAAKWLRTSPSRSRLASCSCCSCCLAEMSKASSSYSRKRTADKRVSTSNQSKQPYVSIRTYVSNQSIRTYVHATPTHPNLPLQVAYSGTDMCHYPVSGAHPITRAANGEGLRGEGQSMQGIVYSTHTRVHERWM